MVSVLTLFIPVRWFLNTFSLYRLNLLGLRRAYVLKVDDSPGADPDGVVPRGREDLLMRDIKRPGEEPPGHAPPPDHNLAEHQR